MTSIPKPEIINSIICILIVLILTFLFVFPRQYVISFVSDIIESTQNMKDGVIKKNKEKALKNSESMIERFNASSDILKLFLNHEDVDELGLHINSCHYALKLDDYADHAAIIVDAETILSICEYLFDVETLSLYNLF